MVVEFDRPQHPLNACQVGRLPNLFVAQELRPCRLGRRREILSRSFAGAMPSSGRLSAGLPKKRSVDIGVAENDHTSNSTANCTTACGPASSGDWSPEDRKSTSELQSRLHLVCRLLLEKKKNT